MSASKQKKNRLAQQGEGLNKKAVAAAEQAKQDKVYRRKAIIALVVIVVIVAAALLINSNLFYTHTTAVQVGNTRYTPAETNYFYKSAYNSLYEYYYNQLGSSISMLLDTSQPLNEQQYSEDQTWADVVFDNAQQEMKRVTTYYDAAVQAGYTLNEEDNASVADAVAQMQSYAESNSFPNLSKFLAAYYGKGMNEKTYTRLCEKVTLANRYAQDLLDSLSYTDEALDAYYAEHAEDYDVYRYYLYSVAFSNEKFADLEEDAQADAAHDAAAAIADADTAEAFEANVAAFLGEETYSLTASSGTAAKLGDSYKDWMTDSSRKTGDTLVVDLESSCYAIMFLSFDDNDYTLKDMRHILVMVETDDDDAYTEEAKAAAEEKIQGIYTDWKLLGDEDSFATLANEYSDDGGSNADGGLYTDIQKDYMVPVVNDFLFAEDHAVGDTEIVFNDGDGGYVGYHLLYLAGEGQNYRRALAEDTMANADYNAKYEELSAGYEVSTGFGVRFANLT